MGINDGSADNKRVSIKKKHFVIMILVVFFLSASLIMSGLISSVFLVNASKDNVDDNQTSSRHSPSDQSKDKSSKEDQTDQQSITNEQSSPPSSSDQSKDKSSIEDQPEESLNSDEKSSPPSSSSPSTSTSRESAVESPNSENDAKASSSSGDLKDLIGRAREIALKQIRDSQKIITSAELSAVAVLACALAIKEAAHGGGDIDECARSLDEWLRGHPKLIEAVNKGICESLGPSTQFCGGRCVDATKNPNCGACGNDCSDTSKHVQGQVCSVRGLGLQQAVCACPEGQKSCGTGVCHDLQTSTTDCGKCGNDCAKVFAGNSICRAGLCQCPDGQVVKDGICQDRCEKDEHFDVNFLKCVPDCTGDLNNVIPDGLCGCEAGQALQCGDQCVDPKTDRDNCGRCGQECAESATCENGFCEPATCNPFASLRMSAAATGSVCNGQCVDTSTNNEHCGTCGNPCGSGQTCTNGQCVTPPECSPENPSGTCPSGQTCEGGQCQQTCPPGSTPGVLMCICSEGTFLSTDGQSCVSSCGPSAVARISDFGANGLYPRCISCSETGPGYAACPTAGGLDAECVNTQTDVRHCGSCGNQCPLQPNNGFSLCQSGTCSGAFCEEGKKLCFREYEGGDCVPLDAAC